MPDIPKWDIWQQLSGAAADVQRAALRRALRRARTASGLTQKEVAARLVQPQSFISKYESGQRALDTVDLLAVCRALQLDMPNFLQLWASELRQESTE